MFKKLLELMLTGFITIAFCGCVVISGLIANYEKATGDFNISSLQALEAAKDALTQKNINFNEPVIDPDIIKINGKYTDGRNLHVNIIKVSDNQCTIKIRVGTSEIGKKYAQDILDAVRERLK